MKQFVSFNLADELYGIPIMSVQEIIQKPQMTRLPQMPVFVEGVVNLRGKIVPVIDMRKRFHLTAGNEDANLRIIVIKVAQQSVGMIVDSVKGVCNLNEDSIEALPESIRSIEREFLEGIGKMQAGIIILLNIEKVFSDMEKNSFTAPESKLG